MYGLESEVKWCAETQTLSGWMVVKGERVHVSIPRAMIHSIPIYNDAVEWEIERHTADILSRLKPLLISGERP